MDAFSFRSVSDWACVICHLYRDAGRPPVPSIPGGRGEAVSLSNDGDALVGS